MSHATLRTVASTVGPGADSTHMPVGRTTTGSFDITVNLGTDAQLAFQGHHPGAPTMIEATVVTGVQRPTGGAHDEFQAMRSYPELDCLGIEKGPASIAEPKAGGTHPVLKHGQKITIRLD